MQKKRFAFGIFLLMLWIGLGVFGHFKSHKRVYSSVAVNFSESPVFLEDSLVNKLLIQNLDKQIKEGNSGVDLNMLESIIEEIPYVETAEIYPLSPRGLALQVDERVAILRVFGTENYYVDAGLSRFPAKSNYSVAVPVFYGNPDQDQLEAARRILQAINNIPRLSGRLSSLYLSDDNSYVLEIQGLPFEVDLGKPTRLRQKCKKIVLFEDFQQQVKDSLLYEQIHLDYTNQIVAIPVSS